MRINEKTALSTSKLLLVPYAVRHVPVYHEWMLDSELREATASEALTIEEEYAMQRQWRDDHDKLTFIICTPAFGSTIIYGNRVDTKETMVGDINLFLFNLDGEVDAGVDEEPSKPAQTTTQLVGELELMIARKDIRRQGFGRAALVAFLQYMKRYLSEIIKEYNMNVDPHTSLAYLRVKIHHTNAGSIALFSSLGFRQTTSEPNYFGEIELRTTDWESTSNLADLDSMQEVQYIDAVD